MKKFLLGAFISAFLLACNNDKKEDKTVSTDTTSSPTSATTQGNGSFELLPMSDADIVKNYTAAFAKGDVDGMTANFDDNIQARWSNGDSIIGKKAVQDYYKGRVALIDSLNYSDQIFLPVNMLTEQTKYAPVGKWVLAWSFAHAKYKNGKKLNFWVHSANHINAAGKIDFIATYHDRTLIMSMSKGEL